VLAVGRSGGVTLTDVEVPRPLARFECSARGHPQSPRCAHTATVVPARVSDALAVDWLDPNSFITGMRTGFVDGYDRRTPQAHAMLRSGPTPLWISVHMAKVSVAATHDILSHGNEPICRTLGTMGGF
jgi:hypothetical protein